MLISSITNNLTFKSSDLRAKRYQVLKQNGLSQFQQASTNKKPGPDNLGNSDISIFERIRNCATYYHNAFLYRRNAYNWDQQINTGNELRKNASTVLCDYKNYESEVRCDIKNQAEKIRRNAKATDYSGFTYLSDDEKVVYERNQSLPYLYKATYSQNNDRNAFVLYNWSDRCFDVEKNILDDDLSRSIEYSFTDGKLTGIQAQCLKGIMDSQDENDVIVEKEFLVDNSNLTVTYKRPEGLNFDTRYFFENNVVRRIDKASDAYARYISSYYYSSDGKLEEIKVQSYAESENGKYPVQTVKSIKLTDN